MSRQSGTLVTEREAEQVRRANDSGRQPVVFIHGLWLLPSSWDRWATLFEEAGYATVTAGWPDDPETVEEANAHPEVFAHKKVAMTADHIADVHRPAVGRQRRVQAPAAQPRRHRDRRDTEPRSRTRHRQRLARSRRHRARVRPPLRLTASARTSASRRPGNGRS